MSKRPDGATPFTTIESALAFYALLSSEIVETTADVRQDVARAQGGSDVRRLQALQLVDYKLQQLSMHVSKSERLLRDLARLRDVIFDGRNGIGREAVEEVCANAAGN